MSCKFCNLEGHSAFNCRQRPRKPLRASTGLAICTTLRKVGKQGNKWIETRKLWFSLHNTPTYMCYICEKLMPKSETTLDHKLSRGRHPELRYVLDNLAPCCLPCNTAKGSLDVDEYLNKLIKQMEGHRDVEY
jgi:5-methylcytosine-specific restriction endonuclease McrA